MSMYLTESDHIDWNNIHPSRKLGKLVGHCSCCGIMMGEAEVSYKCKRCGVVYEGRE